MVRFRATPEQFERLKAYAKKKGEPFSATLRRYMDKLPKERGNHAPD